MNFSREKLIRMSKMDKSHLIKLQIYKPGLFITIFECSHWERDKIFILTDRVNKEEIIGYLHLNFQDSGYWLVKSYHIFEEYENRGIGTEMFIKIIRNGYKILFDDFLKETDAKIIKRMKDFFNIFVYFPSSNKTEDFFEFPGILERDYGGQYIVIASNAVKKEEDLMGYSQKYDGYEGYDNFVGWIRGTNNWYKLNIPGYSQNDEY